MTREPGELNSQFNDDATFKVAPVAGGKVRLEAINYPENFITATPDGEVLLKKNPPPEQSTFVLGK